MDAEELAVEMMSQCVAQGQSVRTVLSDFEAATLRQALRGVARSQQLKVRTARIESSVVVVRRDAAIWGESAATMRAKLTPVQE